MVMIQGAASVDRMIVVQSAPAGGTSGTGVVMIQGAASVNRVIVVQGTPTAGVMSGKSADCQRSRQQKASRNHDPFFCGLIHGKNLQILFWLKKSL